MVSTHLKNISQNGNLPQAVVKIKNIWNHHLGINISGLLFPYWLDIRNPPFLRRINPTAGGPRADRYTWRYWTLIHKWLYKTGIWGYIKAITRFITAWGPTSKLNQQPFEVTKPCTHPAVFSAIFCLFLFPITFPTLSFWSPAVFGSPFLEASWPGMLKSGQTTLEIPLVKSMGLKKVPSSEATAQVLKHQQTVCQMGLKLHSGKLT